MQIEKYSYLLSIKINLIYWNVRLNFVLQILFKNNKQSYLDKWTINKQSWIYIDLENTYLNIFYLNFVDNL